MRFLLFSFAAALMFASTGCIPPEFFGKLGQVAETLGQVARGVAGVSEKLAARDSISMSDLMMTVGGIAVGGAVTGGGVFAVRNGRKKNGG